VCIACGFCFWLGGALALWLSGVEGKEGDE
jgi:hypothetical protein